MLTTAINAHQSDPLILHADERREKIYHWLSAPDHQSKHVNSRKQRQEEETGLWLVQGDCFNDWKIKQNSFLWLHGMRAFLLPADIFELLTE